MADFMSDPRWATVGPALLSNNLVLIAAGVVALLAFNYLLTPRVAPEEPPLLKPTFPIIGHIIGLLTQENEYFRNVHKKHPLPIVTLQMLWGKLYSVWDPVLVQATLRSKGPSFNPITIDFARNLFGVSAPVAARIGEPELLPEFNEAIHASMQAAHVHPMNVAALTSIARTLNKIEPGEHGGLQVDNLYMWLRDIITTATTQALYGKHDPFVKDPSLIPLVWDFEKSVPELSTWPFAQITARKGMLARNRLQAVMGDFYTAECDLDESVARLTAARANVLRKWGFTGMEIGKLDAFLPIVGTTNTAPMTFWMVESVYGLPDLVARLQEEVRPVITRETSADGTDVATVDVSRIEAACPLLVSCYRETLRLNNHTVNLRRLLRDTTIRDANGREYLLREGVDVHIPAGVTHLLDETWGADVAEFNPERFLERPAGSASPADLAADRVKKAAYIPFGGGRHLCPGRAFAFAEILGLMCTVLTGYDLEAVGVPFGKMQRAPARLSTAMLRPMNAGKGQGLRITRKAGWENTQWRYVSSA